MKRYTLFEEHHNTNNQAYKSEKLEEIGHLPLFAYFQIAIIGCYLLAECQKSDEKQLHRFLFIAKQSAYQQSILRFFL